LDANDRMVVRAPKPWIDESAGVPVSSGTSHSLAQQRLYLDQLIAQQLAQRSSGALVVDDARLSSGTLSSSITLLRKLNVPIAAIATVLNEHDPVDSIDGIPYIWLTKLPIFDRVETGWQPREGSYQGLPSFYVEVPP
jgi:adenine/guanine phosphoribosyltransferase-like PRPP-binding protein